MYNIPVLIFILFHSDIFGCVQTTILFSCTSISNSVHEILNAVVIAHARVLFGHKILLHYAVYRALAEVLFGHKILLSLACIISLFKTFLLNFDFLSWCLRYFTDNSGVMGFVVDCSEKVDWELYN